MSELGSPGSRLCDRISCPGCFSGSVLAMDTCGKEDGAGMGKGDVKLWCGPGSLSCPTGSSGAEMMTHRSCSTLGRNLWAFTSSYLAVTGCSCSSKGGRAAIWSRSSPWRSWQLEKRQHSPKLSQLWIELWDTLPFPEAGSGECISVSILEEYLVMWTDAETTILIFKKSLIKRKEKRLHP